jgi:phosphoglycolate phosphatase-like HAD superfamily hydrolase
MMKEKAVFFTTTALVGRSDLTEELSAAQFSPNEWKALRLLTLAGYTIVLLTPERSAVYAECQESKCIENGTAGATCSVAQHHGDMTKQITPLLQATATLQLDLTHSWMIGDRLDSIEVGRLVGCRTVLLADGSETDWEMTAMRWPDLIAGDMWEIACLIVMSDGSSIEGLSVDLEDDED